MVSAAHSSHTLFWVRRGDGDAVQDGTTLFRLPELPDRDRSSRIGRRPRREGARTYFPSTSMSTVLSRGPSSSTRKMFCQVPRTSLPFLTARHFEQPR